MKTRYVGGALAAVLALALVTTACSSNGDGGGGAASAGGGGSTATIVAQGLAFHPTAVTVSAGTVTLTVTNKDTVLHTFTLDDGSSTTNLEPGTTQTITLQLSATVGWHCNIHKSMTGTLTVA